MRPKYKPHGPLVPGDLGLTPTGAVAKTWTPGKYTSSFLGNMGERGSGRAQRWCPMSPEITSVGTSVCPKPEACPSAEAPGQTNCPLPQKAWGVCLSAGYAVPRRWQPARNQLQILPDSPLGLMDMSPAGFQSQMIWGLSLRCQS